jgi:hypothetical protein
VRTVLRSFLDNPINSAAFGDEGRSTRFDATILRHVKSGKVQAQIWATESHKLAVAFEGVTSRVSLQGLPPLGLIHWRRRSNSARRRFSAVR